MSKTDILGLDTAVYAHQWVALAGEHIAGFGQTGPEALRLARRNWPKQKQFKLRYVEPEGGQPLTIPPLLEQLLPFVEQLDQPIYVVGGAVRDMLDGRVPHDLDLIVAKGAISCGFKMGDFLGAPAYAMDKVRDVSRIILPERDMVDIARLRGGSLEADLHDRDLTINALALPVAARTSASVIDVVGGRADLANGIIRQASPTSLLQDPVRGLRVLRMALKLGFEIEEETAANTHLSFRQRHATSPERIRDELFNLLRVNPAGAVRGLHELGGLADMLPPLAPLDGVRQSAPHVWDVLGHTIGVLDWLGQVEAAVDGRPCSPPELAEWLAPWRGELQAHLARPVPGHIDGNLLWRWAAVLHDVGKPATQTVEEESGRIRFFGHDKVGAELAGDFLRSLHLSGEAVSHVQRTVAGHMRPLLMANDTHTPTRRTIYRFFKRCGKSGLDVALLCLADHLGTYGGVGDGQAWQKLGHIVTQLLHHYFEQYEETVRPVPLVSGRELMKQLQLPQGPEVGRLLAILEEAQAAGEITTAEEALALAKEERREKREENG